MVKLEYEKTIAILSKDNYTFKISKHLADYIKNTNSLNDDVIEVTESKTGVVTLKIKSLTYSYNDKSKILNLYKINNKEKLKMKVFIKFMKPKKETDKPNPFNNFIVKTVKPVIKDIEFNSLDEVKSKVYDALKPYMTEESKWEIEDNTKTAGIVVKNVYQKTGKPYPSHNIFFINIVQAVEEG